MNRRHFFHTILSIFVALIWGKTLPPFVAKRQTKGVGYKTISVPLVRRIYPQL